MKRSQRDLLIFAAIGAAVSFGIAALRGLFKAEAAIDTWRILCDGCFVAGVLLVGIYSLSWVGGQGLMNGLAFSVKTVLSLKWSVFGNFRESYEEYKERKKGKQRLPKEMLFAGLFFIALSIVFLILYISVSK